MDRAEKTATSLLQIKAIKLQPEKGFVWASGWQSPIYCDNRVLLSFPEIRSELADGLASLLRESYPHTQAIAAVATGAIAMGALVAERLSLPMIYVRPEPKAHGLGKQIEGHADASLRYTIVEDLVSTGKSSLAALQALRREGIEVEGMVALFTYGFQTAEDNFQEAGCKLTTMLSYPQLIRRAIELQVVSEELLATLESWRANPSTWKAHERA